MIVFKYFSDIQSLISQQRQNGVSIGFIPTMGALHSGHISLIQKAKEDKQFVICSIFVNPTQFNDPKDFEKYPSTIGADISLLELAKCDALITPSVEEVYPKGGQSVKSFSFGHLETVFEGAMRPGHFAGVGKVMSILLNKIMPDKLYMGSKDYQQCLIVKDLCRQLNLDKKIDFITCPTVREPDGLAMSSRNRRLDGFQRSKVGIIYQCLVSIQNKFMLGNSVFNIVQKECIDLLINKGIKVEYLELANAHTFTPLTEFDPKVKMVILAAVWVGEVRLIDNIIIN